jgi:DNA-binding NtrC family response regulator
VADCKLLLVDDEPSIRLALGNVLNKAGYDVTISADGHDACQVLEDSVFDLIISDIRLPGVNGLDILDRVMSRPSPPAMILITGHGDIEDAVRALKNGAQDYVTKPFEMEEMLLRVERISERRSVDKQLKQAQAALRDNSSGSFMVGRSTEICNLREKITTIAPSNAAVFISGESGTGKELVARMLHATSLRHERKLVSVNCAAFPETLLEGELFGHAAGAFTGAVGKRQGRFKTADGGTLFLDEVADIPLLSQVKLLRVLQEGRLAPLGADEEIDVDVRVVSATNRDLTQLMRDNQFREDLFYRLNVINLHVPPLRQRAGDIPMLVEHFMGMFLREGSERPSISPQAWAALTSYGYPGNVRELEHAIHHAVVLSCGKEIDLQHLPRAFKTDSQDLGESLTSVSRFRELPEAMKEFERMYLKKALEHTKGKKSEAASLLGISRKNLWEKLKAHGVSQ